MVEEENIDLPMRGINDVQVEVSYGINQRVQQNREKKPKLPVVAVHKPFFEELDAASIDIKRVLRATQSDRKNEIMNEDQKYNINEEEMLRDSSILMGQASREADRSRR